MSGSVKLIPQAVAAYWTLLVFERFLKRNDFAGLCAKVRDCRTPSARYGARTIERVCRAVNIACAWHTREIRCLQRAAATAFLLKRRGVDAKMVIGARAKSFQAHAWVEVDGLVINDPVDLGEMYCELERC